MNLQNLYFSLNLAGIVILQTKKLKTIWDSCILAMQYFI